MVTYADILQRLEGLEQAAKNAQTKLQNIQGIQKDMMGLLKDVANQAMAGGRPSGSYDQDPWGNPTGITERGVVAGELGKTPIMENKRDMQAEAREEKQEAIEQNLEQQEAAKTAPTPIPMD